MSLPLLQTVYQPLQLLISNTNSHAAAASGKDIVVQTGAARLFLSAPFLTLQAVLESDLIPTEQYCNLI